MSVHELPPRGETPKPSSEPMSRRAFLTRSALVGGGVMTVAGTAVLHHVLSDRHKSEIAAKNAYAAQADERFNLEERDRDVKRGMERYWKKATVWPGLAILQPNVKLFGMVTLQPDSEIAWPKEHQDDHLAVQRPFLVLKTYEDDGFVPGAGDLPPGPGVMSFWMPGSDEIAFVDQQAYASEILMPTNSQAAIYEAGTNRNGIAGEEVELKPALSRDGLTYRYLVNVGGSNFNGEPDVVDKVCGRSAWTALPQEATDYFVYQHGPRAGSDPIQLPPPEAR